MEFKDKVILITGASKGIGKHLAEKLIDMGANVIGVYNNTLINHVYVDAYKCDLKNENEILELFCYIKNNYDTLDYVINCAAISDDCDITEKTKESFMQVLEVNLVGTYLVCKKALELMENGVIINMSSTDATTTYNSISIDYCASKAGIEALTKCLSLIKPQVKVCALAPNWVETETTLNMNPDYLKNELKRIKQNNLITKDEVVNKIIEIISNDNINSGEIIRMDDSNE